MRARAGLWPPSTDSESRRQYGTTSDNEAKTTFGSRPPSPPPPQYHYHHQARPANAPSGVGTDGDDPRPWCAVTASRYKYRIDAVVDCSCGQRFADSPHEITTGSLNGSVRRPVLPTGLQQPDSAQSSSSCCLMPWWCSRLVSAPQRLNFAPLRYYSDQITLVRYSSESGILDFSVARSKLNKFRIYYQKVSILPDYPPTRQFHHFSRTSLRSIPESVLARPVTTLLHISKLLKYK